MFESNQPHQTFGGAVEVPAIAAPSGQRLPLETLRMLQDVPTMLKLPHGGVLSVWAQSSNLESHDVAAGAPDISIFPITPQQVVAAKSKMFGHPIPYLGVVTKNALSEVALDHAFEDTDYEPYESFVVYRQDDPQAVPVPYYFHWISLAAEEPHRKSLTQALSEIRGHLVFAVRVSIPGGREAPSMSSEFATMTDVRGVGESAAAPLPVELEEPPAPILAETAEQPTKHKAASHMPYLLAAAGAAAVLTVLVGRKARRR